MRIKTLPWILLTILTNSAAAESNYVCIVDLVSGFHHDMATESWQHATFLPGERFTVSEFSDGTYAVKKMDVQKPWSANCTPRQDQTEDSLSCRSKTNEFHFNRKELRFTAFRYFGYWNGSKDSLSISIGKCYPDQDS